RSPPASTDLTRPERLARDNAAVRGGAMRGLHRFSIRSRTACGVARCRQRASGLAAAAVVASDGCRRRCGGVAIDGSYLVQVVEQGSWYGKPGTYCAHSSRVMASPTVAHIWAATCSVSVSHSQAVLSLPPAARVCPSGL